MTIVTIIIIILYYYKQWQVVRELLRRLFVKNIMELFESITAFYNHCISAYYVFYVWNECPNYRTTQLSVLPKCVMSACGSSDIFQMGSLWSLATPAIFEIVLVVRTYVLVFEPRIHARSSHVFLSASKKRQHICMEPEVLFSTWRSICCAVLRKSFWWPLLNLNLNVNSNTDGHR